MSRLDILIASDQSLAQDLHKRLQLQKYPLNTMVFPRRKIGEVICQQSELSPKLIVLWDRDFDPIDINVQVLRRAYPGKILVVFEKLPDIARVDVLRWGADEWFIEESFNTPIAELLASVYRILKIRMRGVDPEALKKFTPLKHSPQEKLSEEQPRIVEESEMTMSAIASKEEPHEANDGVQPLSKIDRKELARDLQDVVVNLWRQIKLISPDTQEGKQALRDYWKIFGYLQSEGREGVEEVLKMLNESDQKVVPLQKARTSSRREK